MNENSDPKPTPPPIPVTEPAPKPRPDRYEFAPMQGERNLPGVLENLLKHPGRVVWELTSGRPGSVMLALLLLTVVSLGIYGVIAGSLSGGSQLWIAPVKIVGGSLLSLFICLPSLYIFLCLCGADARLRQVAGLAVASACLTALLLISFAPVAWVFSQSTDSVALMGMLHLIFWVVALWFGLGFLKRSAVLSQTNLNGGNLPVWMLIYIVVSLQMMTSLRPIIGRSETFLPTSKQFFLAHFGETIMNETDPK